MRVAGGNTKSRSIHLCKRTGPNSRGRLKSWHLIDLLWLARPTEAISDSLSMINVVRLRLLTEVVFKELKTDWPSWKHRGWDGGKVWNQIVSRLLFQTEHPVSLTGQTAGPNIFLFAKSLTIVQTSEIIEGKAATGASYFEALEAMLRQLFPLCSSVSIPTAANAPVHSLTSHSRTLDEFGKPKTSLETILDLINMLHNHLIQFF